MSGCCARKVPSAVGRKLDYGGDVGEDPDVTARSGGMAAQFCVELFRLVQDATGTCQESVPGGRELHAFRPSNEQGRAERLFEIGESLADGRRNRVAALRRTRNAAGLRDGDEVLEIAEVKGPHGM